MTLLLLGGPESPSRTFQARPLVFIFAVGIWGLATAAALWAANRHLDCDDSAREAAFLKGESGRLAGEVRRLTAAYSEAVRLLPQGLPAPGRITSRFGNRPSPLENERREFHPGWDIANAPGTEVRATADGVVAEAGWAGGYGMRILVKHAPGLSTLFGHAARLLVRPGQAVKKGQALAVMGDTGRSTGTHVHYEVRYRGKAVDPARFIE